MRLVIDIDGDEATQIEIWFQHHGGFSKAGTSVWCKYRGSAYEIKTTLSIKDKHVKALGRRAALAKLLKTGIMQLVPYRDSAQPFATHKWQSVLSFTREQRRQVWNAYFDRHADLRK